MSLEKKLQKFSEKVESLYNREINSDDIYELQVMYDDIINSLVNRND